MEWHPAHAQSLRKIEQILGANHLPLAQSLIVQRVVWATGDFSYSTRIQFSNDALAAGAAALVARTPVIVDGPMLQAGIAEVLSQSFANPTYGPSSALSRPQRTKTQAAWGIETLAQRYPQAIFVLGEDQTTLSSLQELVQTGAVTPALVIATAANVLESEELESEGSQNLAEDWLVPAEIPCIYTQGHLGSVVVAATVLNTLAELAWQVYGLNQP